MPVRVILAMVFPALFLAAFVVWPGIDLWVSGFFASSEQGFFWREAWWVKALTNTVFYGSRGLGVVLIVGLCFAVIQKCEVFGLSPKALAFLFLALLVGPGLVANVILKDTWGRARPRDIVAFGGTATFTPALIPSQECRTNCSFVSGDASFGFFLSSFGYVAAPRLRRRVFWSGMGLGTFFSAARVMAGAHFLSDVVFAIAFMLATSALTHAALFGREATRAIWKDVNVFRARRSTL